MATKFCMHANAIFPNILTCSHWEKRIFFFVTLSLESTFLHIFHAHTHKYLVYCWIFKSYQQLPTYFLIIFRKFHDPVMNNSLDQGSTNFQKVWKLPVYFISQKHDLKQFWNDLSPLLVSGAFRTVHVNWYTFLYIRGKTAIMIPKILDAIIQN
jgi:hypothetical protein